MMARTDPCGAASAMTVGCLKMLSLRQLEYLVALAETGNFRRAAERVNTSQPTLSEQIKALEDRLGTQVVERTRTGALLTPIGAEVVEIARRMLKDANEIRALAGSGDKVLRGVLRLGLPATIGPYLLPSVVPRIHRAYPDLKLYVREELPETLPRSLTEGAYDLIITPLPVRGDDLVAEELVREPLFLTMAVDHPLARKAVIERQDLAGQEVLTLGPGHQLHDVVQALCDEFGARVRLDYEGTSLDMVREMVITGLGISFMPGLYVRRELRQDPDLKLKPIHGRAIHRTIGMAWRKTSARAESFAAIAELVRTIVRTELGDLNKLT
jgi:LysR family transcriptional regulator, hydrogen peroxide-inducible genes activator